MGSLTVMQNLCQWYFSSLYLFKWSHNCITFPLTLQIAFGVTLMLKADVHFCVHHKLFFY